jgi:histidinol-phosphatase
MSEVAFGPEWSASLRRGSEGDLRGWVDAALAWCDATDDIALRHLRRTEDLQIQRKPDRTFVTVADTAIERLLRERIADAFPDHGVLGEELGDDAGGAATRWIIDPIDGTHNYLRGIPLFATLIAVERDGELQAAVISAPSLGDRWFAWRGGGAWVARGRDGGAPARIRTSAIPRLDEAQVLYASALEIEASGRAPGFRGLLEAAWRERGFGDFWGYTLVAEGAAEVMVEPDLSPWDAAAPVVLVEEAGGRATDLAGRRSVHNRTFLATNGHLHDLVLQTLAEREETSR